MRFRGTMKTMLAAGVIGVVSVAPFPGAAPVAADEVTDLQHRAAQISSQLDALQAQVIDDTAAVESASREAELVADKIDRAQTQLAAAKRDEAANRRDLSEFALSAYVNGGTGDVNLAELLDTDAGKIGPREGYRSAAVGDRQELVDQLEASQAITADRAAVLRTEQAHAAAISARARAKRDAADAAQRKLQKIQSQLQGRLATLVAERRAAAERAAEARAKAAVQAREQAAAAAQAARTPTTTAAAPTAATVAPTSSAAPLPPPAVPAQPPIAPVPPSSGRGAQAVAAAQSVLGVPYVYGGGHSMAEIRNPHPRGLDCSGFVAWAWYRAGVNILGTTHSQRYAGPSVPISQLRPGDLVFYLGFDHVGLYAGNGSIIHAPHTGDVVRYASLYIDGGPIYAVRPG